MSSNAEQAGPRVPDVITVTRTGKGARVLIDGEPFPLAVGPRIDTTVDVMATQQTPAGHTTRMPPAVRVELLARRVEVIDGIAPDVLDVLAAPGFDAELPAPEPRPWQYTGYDDLLRRYGLLVQGRSTSTPGQETS
jgi:hypothetical protein